MTHDLYLIKLCFWTYHPKAYWTYIAEIQFFFQQTLSVNKLWHFLYHWVGQKSWQKSQFTLAIITKPYNCRQWYFLWFNYLWCTTCIPSLRAFWGGSECFWYIWHGITHMTEASAEGQNIAIYEAIKHSLCSFLKSSKYFFCHASHLQQSNGLTESVSQRYACKCDFSRMMTSSVWIFRIQTRESLFQV